MHRRILWALSPLLGIVMLSHAPAGPVFDFGDGHDGELIVGGDMVLPAARTWLTATAASGDLSLNVGSTIGFQAGDEIMIVTMFDPSGEFGAYELLDVTSVSGGSTLALGERVTQTYVVGGGRAHQVLEVPNFTTVQQGFGSRLTAPRFVDLGFPLGGVLAFRATGLVTLSEVELTGRGYHGGLSDDHQGESGLGTGIVSPDPNGGGGGGGGFIGAGGGGGHGTQGRRAGSSFVDGSGGLTYGTAAMTTFHMGSGGGGGFRGDGSPGGGAVFIAANMLRVRTTINVDGESTDTQGGGGSGGSIRLICREIVMEERATVSSLGGEPAEGGEGGVGRIRIDVASSFPSEGVEPRPYFGLLEVVSSLNEMDFGTRDLTAPPLTITVQYSNTGGMTLRNLTAEIEGENPDDFHIFTDTGQTTLSPEATRAVEVLFTPRAVGPKSATLVFSSDDITDFRIEIPLRGTATQLPNPPPEIGVEPPVLDFGEWPVNTSHNPLMHAVISNFGDGELNFTGEGIALSGFHRDDFLFPAPRDILPLLPDTARSVPIVFDPTTIGVKFAEMVITTDDEDEPTVIIPLSGIGGEPVSPAGLQTSEVVDDLIGEINLDVDVNGDAREDAADAVRNENLIDAAP